MLLERNTQKQFLLFTTMSEVHLNRKSQYSHCFFFSVDMKVSLQESFLQSWTTTSMLFMNWLRGDLRKYTANAQTTGMLFQLKWRNTTNTETFSSPTYSRGVQMMTSVQPVMWKSRPPIHRAWLLQQLCVNPLQQKIWPRPSFPDSNLRNDFIVFQTFTENLDFNQLRHLAQKLNQKGKFLMNRAEKTRDSG